MVEKPVSTNDLRQMEDRVQQRIDQIRDEVRDHDIRTRAAVDRIVALNEREIATLDRMVRAAERIAPSLDRLGEGAHKLSNGAMEKLITRVVIWLVLANIIGSLVALIGSDAVKAVLSTFMHVS